MNHPSISRSFRLDILILLLLLIITTFTSLSAFTSIPSFQRSSFVATSISTPLSSSSYTTTNILLHSSSSPTAPTSITQEEDPPRRDTTPPPPTPKSSSSSSTTTSSSLEMPWSEFQEWALNDHLPHYLITLPPSSTSTKSTKSYALWHTLLREVTELRGYSIPFVRHQHSLSEKTISPSSDETPLALPLLEQFQFTPNGGISGDAYGIPGIAKGTRIQTPPLSLLSETLPHGYVLLESVRDDDDDEDDEEEDGIILAYELGQPRGVEVEQHIGEGGKESRSKMLQSLSQMLLENAPSRAKDALGELSPTSKSLHSLGTVMVDESTNGDGDTAQLVFNIGGITSLLLAGATIMNAFHHHLTVNVFWV